MNQNKDNNHTKTVCPIHGPYISKKITLPLIGKTISSACPACTGQYHEQQRIKQYEEQKQQAQQLWLNQLKTACIPKRFHDRTLKNYLANLPVQQKALDFANNYSESFHQIRQTGRSAIFCGLPGTGKTHLAAAIAHEIIKQGKTVLFTTVYKAIRSVKSTWNPRSTLSEQEVTDILVFPDLLILDEVGVQFGSETEKIILFDIINTRYEQRKPILLLSNLNPDGVKYFLGPRVFDRLREDGGKCVYFNWASHRRKNNDQPQTV